MSSQEKDLVPPAIMAMPETELDDFHISGSVQPSKSNERAKKATLNNPKDQVADEETVKSPFAMPDELVAKVLGYLPLRDRFRLETVCRQWKRCMYLEVGHLYLYFGHEVNQIYTLRIKNVGSDYESITMSWTDEQPAVLHKLRKSKVSHLTCDIEDAISDRELFVLLADIASQATKVVVAYGIRYHPTNLVTFCDIIGLHVTTFVLGLHDWRMLPEDIQVFADSLAKMNQLKEVCSNWPELIFTCLNSLPTNFLPHFQEIDIAFCSKFDWKLWEHFKSLYGAQLKKITFRNGHWLVDQREVWLPWKDMAPFAILEHLDFRFSFHDCTLTALAEDLEAISSSCPLLKSFSLRQTGSLNERFVVSLTEVRKLFVAIGKMKMLEKLGLELGFCFEDFGGIFLGENLDLFALLENKSNITHLKANVTLCQVSSPNEQFQREIFSTLNSTMPNLRHLIVGCMSSELDHFVGLERMQTISLSYVYSEEAFESSQDSLIRILTSSPALRSFKFCYTFAEVSEALIGTIMEVAELQMEKHIDFIVEIMVFNHYQGTWEAMKHLAPRNLMLTFDYNWNSNWE